MKKKNILCLLIFFFSSTIMVVWSFGDQAVSSFDSIVRENGKPVNKETLKDPVLIAFATPLKQVSDYWRRSIDSFKGRLDEIGLSYSVAEFSTKVDENRKLKECVVSAIETNPAYLILTLNDPSDKLIVSRLLEKKRPKIIVQNVTTPDAGWKKYPPFMYVGFDHPTGAKLIADEYIKRLKNKQQVEYAMLYHVRGNQVSVLRGDRFNELIAKLSDFRLIAEYFTEGNRQNARMATLKIISKYPDISFIHACSTDIAFGILDALKERNLEGKILVNGWGGGANELESIMSGGLDFTVMRMNDDNGVAMAEAIRLDLEDKIKDAPIVYSGSMVIVRQGISDKELLKLKKRAFRYSGIQ